MTDVLFYSDILNSDFMFSFRWDPHNIKIRLFVGYLSLAAHFHFIFTILCVKCAKCNTIQFIQCHTKMAPRQNGVLLGW